jgi:ABC-type multidrug transport system fused ATPase/permease subunit
MVFNDVITFLLPNITFLLIIAVYFTYKSWKIGGAFILGNLILLGYLYVNWDTMTDLNRHYESHISENEGSLIEILNNIDKIITRGQVNAEVTEYLGKTNEGINKAFDFYSSTNNHGVVMNGIVYLIIFLLIGYLISGFFNKQVDLKTFITFFTILILYRDRMFSAIQQIPDFIEFMGRSDAVLKHFKDTADDYVGIMGSRWAPMNLGFDVIKFENVRFKYKSSENYVMDNASFALETDGKIIGVTGLSGRGKSTFAKLLIKLYKPESGKIYIDGVDIESVDTDYIRRNITYVNQTSKLFDKKILENIFYGCGDIAVCQERLGEILKYDKIRELFKNVDLENTRAGSLGEGLSGGQRQVVNIISGLVNDSKILILDEPTNALDGDLKKTVLEIIRRFKDYKKCIIVITHDKDMDAIFTDKMSL